jgi:predicted alpha/beta-fold hydrolase
MPPTFPAFRPRPPWLGPDLQTLRNTFVPVRPDFSACESQRLILPLADGSGDRLAALLQRPRSVRRPLVVLVHGLSGTEESAYMQASAAALLAAGHPVLRLNLRGAGASRPLCRLQYHAGRTGDLRDALAGLDPALCDGGIFLVGYSLGGNMLLKFLAEYAAQFPICAAAAVSPPLDLGAAARRILERRNRLYHFSLLRWMQAESLGSGATVTVEEQYRIRAARTILEFDDRFVAPRNGYAGAAAYYADNSSARFLAALRVPTLVIHALDDPWIPSAAYRTVAWKENPNLIPLLPDSGGHVGFHGRGSAVPWHDRCVAQFFAQALEGAAPSAPGEAGAGEITQSGRVAGMRRPA